MQSEQRGKRLIRRRRRKGWNPRTGVFLTAFLVCLGILAFTARGTGDANGEAQPPDQPANALAAITQAPTPIPTPTPEPTPAPYDYSAPAPASEPVGMDYFADAVFIGDSRTDGLKLYSGITGTTFLSYRGITVFDVMERPDKKIIEINGTSYTVLEALALGQYRKVYTSLGVNELGYLAPERFASTYGDFLTAIERIQPDAQIYVQLLVPINPEKAAANNQASWLTNENLASYNALLRQLCVDRKIVFLDPSEVLADENGILPADATADGLHFTRAWYEKWLAYLMSHTVTPA